MEILEILLVILVIIIIWGLISYITLWANLNHYKIELNSPNTTNEKIIKLKKSLKFKNYFVGIIYGGPIGYFLAKKIFIPKSLNLLDQKIKERNIEI